jgi:hypothetical protein
MKHVLSRASALVVGLEVAPGVITGPAFAEGSASSGSAPGGEQKAGDRWGAALSAARAGRVDDAIRLLCEEARQSTANTHAAVALRCAGSLATRQRRYGEAARLLRSAGDRYGRAATAGSLSPENARQAREAGSRCFAAADTCAAQDEYAEWTDTESVAG